MTLRLNHTVLKPIIVVLVLLLAVSCSRVKFIYNQLDWWVPQFIQDYVTLNDKQKALLNEQWLAFKQWHCRSEIPRYRVWLSNINETLQKQKLDLTAAEEARETVMGFWWGFTGGLVDPATTLFASLGKEQIDEVFKNMEKYNSEYTKKYVEPAPEKVRKRLRKLIEKRVDYWLGGLSNEQDKLLDETVSNLTLLGEDGLQGRQHWQKALRDTLSHIHDKAKLKPAVKDLFLNYRRLWAPEYRKKRAANEDTLMAFLVGVNRTLTDDQKRHLKDRVTSWVEDLGEIECAP